MVHRWIDLDGVANLRDLGGTPTTDGGEIRPGRLLRSDNLQTLTDADITALEELGLTDVVDLRSSFEVDAEGDGPLIGHHRVAVHHHSLIPEQRQAEGALPGAALPGAALPGAALPWVGLAPSVTVADAAASSYLSYLVDRPESVIASLRDIAGAEGAALVHCAAGKDRTGTIVALALLVAGAEPDAIVADYAASTERMERILQRLMASPTYVDNLRGRPVSSHATRPETMAAFLDYVEQEWGGVDALLATMGWTDEDSATLRAKLRD